MMKMRWLLLLVLVFLHSVCQAQIGIGDTCSVDKEVFDSLTIAAVENLPGTEKVLHAEPLYIDLIRDLGARKGEREWNIAWGMRDFTSYTTYEGLIEYEWAPVNRLGLEVEVPFELHTNNAFINLEPTPSKRIDGLKLAAQYSYYVSEKRSVSLAAGYIHQFLTTDFQKMRAGSRLHTGNIFNPFLVGAKRWTSNWHSLIYTGIRKFIDQERMHKGSIMATNLSVHYMITGTRNFAGLELNHERGHDINKLMLRPQLRLCITDHSMLGIVTSLPLRGERERMGAFFRLIYEPPHKQKKTQVS